MKNENLSLRNTISRRFKAIRVQLDLFQKDLSHKLGIPIKNISTIEIGGQFPPVPLIIKLYDNFHISPLWLLKGEGEMFLKDKEPELGKLDYFKKAFPGVPAEPDVIGLIESLAIPVLKNSLILKSLELKEIYRPQIEAHEKGDLKWMKMK